ncbi:Sds3-like, partial [Geosmithia morbida]
MAATAAVPYSASPSGQQEDSNISSPLSEVDDKDANDDVMDMHIDPRDKDGVRPAAETPPDTTHHDDSDSESVLSDARSVAHSDAHSDGNDTEAETERLYNTPHHQRQRDVIFENDDAPDFEHTPSKLRTAALVDDDNDLADESITDVGDGAPNTPSKSSNVNHTPGEQLEKGDAAKNDLLDSQERKRKRSPAADSSDPEQPLRKRTGSVHDIAGNADTENTAEKDLEAPPAAHIDGGGGASPKKQTTSADEESTERETRSSKKATRRSMRRKGSADDPDEDTPIGHDDDAAENDALDERDRLRDTAEAEAEEEADAAAKSTEEGMLPSLPAAHYSRSSWLTSSPAERKQAAFKDWSRIEDMFGIFRDRLYSDRLQRLEEEERSLLADEPTHREYLNMKKCLDDRLEKKLREVENEYELRMKAHQRRSVAIHAQIWSQYTQGAREKRASILEALNREWYDVQTARRNAHSVPERGLIFPKDPAQRIRNAVAYNTEVSTLAGIAKYKGFPAGPDVKGASPSELADDFSMIEHSRHTRQRPTWPPREEYQTPSFNRLGPAGEQFLKETPWANPNHSSHKMLLQEIPKSQSAGDPTATAVDVPLSQQRSPATSSRPSESPELTRVALKAASSIKRTGNLSNPG